MALYKKFGNVYSAITQEINTIGNKYFVMQTPNIKNSTRLKKPHVNRKVCTLNIQTTSLFKWKPITGELECKSNSITIPKLDISSASYAITAILQNAALKFILHADITNFLNTIIPNALTALRRMQI